MGGERPYSPHKYFNLLSLSHLSLESGNIQQSARLNGGRGGDPEDRWKSPGGGDKSVVVSKMLLVAL